MVAEHPGVIDRRWNVDGGGDVDDDDDQQKESLGSLGGDWIFISIPALDALDALAGCIDRLWLLDAATLDDDVNTYFLKLPVPRPSIVLPGCNVS